MPEISREEIGQPSQPGADASQQAAPQQAVPPAPQQAPSEATSEAPSAEYVFPDDPSIPEIIRGKKASEAASVVGTLFDTSKRMADYLRQQAGAPPAASPPMAQPNTTTAAPEIVFDKDDFLTGEPAAIQTKIERIFEQKAQPFLLDIYRGLTISSLNTARQTLPHFQRYEPEILQEMAHVPINLTAHYQTWKDAHDRVTSRHIDEIMAERARARPTPPVTERGNGQTVQAQQQGLQAVQLDSDDVRIADGLGVPRDVFLRMKNLYANATKGL